ncbi:MAG TPA: hypothetical protein VNV82_02600 [Bryobacteraceae bacterium]|jgi:Uma2 family endonuclease|nr:hypothetical protein [Bryobacteraceae bacterium]
MGTAGTLILVEEYLRTNYDPVREYVDGEVVEKNLGEKTHSRIQRKLLVYFAASRSSPKTTPCNTCSKKIDDYLSFGVPCVWIINPQNRKGYVVTSEGMFEAKSGILETKDPAISVPLTVLFE